MLPMLHNAMLLCLLYAVGDVLLHPAEGVVKGSPDVECFPPVRACVLVLAHVGAQAFVYVHAGIRIYVHMRCMQVFMCIDIDIGMNMQLCILHVCVHAHASNVRSLHEQGRFAGGGGLALFVLRGRPWTSWRTS